MIEVRPLGGVLGAEIAGIDLADPASEADLPAVVTALHRHQVIVLRGQAIDPARFVAVSRHFGSAQPHIAAHLRHPEHPEILLLSNIFEDGESIGIYDGAAYWHTDMSYEDPPGAATLVHSLQAPDAGGETAFAGMQAAYEALPDAMKRRIDGLTVLHHYGNRSDLEEVSRTSATPLKADQQKQLRNVFHPLVKRHPATGRPALYAVAGSSFGIVGMPDDKARALLDELMAHATRPEFVHSHRYAVGDLVVWDNHSTLHKASLLPPATGPEDSRLLHRISVKD